MVVFAFLLSLNSAFQFQCLLLRIKVLGNITIDPGLKYLSSQAKTNHNNAKCSLVSADDILK